MAYFYQNSSRMLIITRTSKTISSKLQVKMNKFSKMTNSGQEQRPRTESTVESPFNLCGAVITGVYSSNSKGKPASAGINFGQEKTSTMGRISHQEQKGQTAAVSTPEGQRLHLAPCQHHTLYLCTLPTVASAVNFFQGSQSWGGGSEPEFPGPVVLRGVGGSWAKDQKNNLLLDHLAPNILTPSLVLPRTWLNVAVFYRAPREKGLHRWPSKVTDSPGVCPGASAAAELMTA